MISRFFIDHPRFAFVISILFMIGGLIAITVLPVAQYPDIAPSQISITANYPGADAQTLMNTVIQPIETNINGVKRMIYFNSTATDSGSASINVSFDIGTDGDMNTVNTQNRVNWTSGLPEEVQRQGVTTKERSSNMLLVVSLYSPDSSLDELALSNFMTIYVKDRLARIPGVGDVSMFGEKKYAIRAWLDPDKMASLGISVSEVASAIKAQNVQVSAGALGDSPATNGQMLRLAISTQGRMTSVEEFERIVIRSEDDGSSVRLSNIARVELGAENYSSIAQSNGSPSASLAVYQLTDANGLEIAKQVNAELENIKETMFPPGLDYRIQYDSTKFISSSISEVVSTLIEAVLLVILVTFIFLQDWRSTLVPTIAIPVSLIGTFAVMYAIGFSINLITLFGLILAIGIVVDDAIVVIENVNRLIEEEHLSPRDAAVKSMEQVTGPVIATTAVLLAMFIPVCFLPGITGVMYRQFGITISVAVVISSINALTLSPALSAILLKPLPLGAAKRKKFILFRWFDSFFDKLTGAYGFVVKHLVRKAFLVLIATCGVLFLALRIFTGLPSGFVPDEDQGAFFVSVQLPDAASLERTQAVCEKINAVLAKTDTVDAYMTVAGYNILQGVASSNNALVLVTLKDWGDRPDMPASSVMRKFMADTSGISEAVIMPFGVPAIPGIGTTGGLSFVIQDSSGTVSPAEMQNVVNGFIAEANDAPEIASAFTTYRAAFPQVYVEVDREKALKMGVALSDVNDALQGLFGYSYINDFNKFGKTYKVEIQADSRYRELVVDLSSVRIPNDEGGMVPLGTLAEIKTRHVPQFLQHYNMLSSVTVSATPASGVSSGQAMAALENIARKTLPAGMTYDWTDMSYQEKKAGSQIFMIFGLAIVFIYLFLVAQYESWTVPLSVIASVPVAFLGGALSLLLMRMDNNIYAQVGFVLLFGIACKTAILIVEFAKERHERDGLDVVEAAEYAARLRFRAVLMTAVSFILGTWPLVVAFGACSVSRRSLGTAVFGGMLVSVVLGTLCIPALYVVIQKITEFCTGKAKRQ